MHNYGDSSFDRDSEDGSSDESSPKYNLLRLDNFIKECIRYIQCSGAD